MDVQYQGVSSSPHHVFRDHNQLQCTNYICTDDRTAHAETLAKIYHVVCKFTTHVMYVVCVLS